MTRKLTGLLALIGVMVFLLGAKKEAAMDTIKTSGGDLRITFIGHATLMFEFNGKVIHVDPWSNLADYSKFPKADIILVTHEHVDHLDSAAIRMIRKDDTQVMVNPDSAKTITGSMVMTNGQEIIVQGIKITAVPAYNIVNQRGPGRPYHPRGAGNGYVLTFGDKRVYVAGDTENTPEMKAIKDLECAFLPMNLPYTMTPEMVADAAKAMMPKIVYPYHYGETDPNKLSKLLEGSGIEVRIRKME